MNNFYLRPIIQKNIGVLFLIIFYLLTNGCNKRKNDVENFLSYSANELSKSCPIQIDEITKINSVVSLGNKTILYKLELDYNPTKQEIKRLTQQIKNSFRTNPQYELLRNNNVNVVYNYDNSDREYLFKIEFNCGELLKQKFYKSQKFNFTYPLNYEISDYRATRNNIDAKLVYLDENNQSGNRSNIVFKVVQSNSNMKQRIFSKDTYNELINFSDNYSFDRIVLSEKEIALLTLELKNNVFMKSYNFIEKNILCTITITTDSKTKLELMSKDLVVILKEFILNDI